MLKKWDKKLFFNTLIPLLLETVTIVSSLILPRMMLKCFGSNVNGLVSSITQFLSVISFLEMGVGNVVRYNLYKPLAEKDNVQLSKIVSSANKFFRTLALILLGYVIVLMVVFPLIDGSDFSHLFSATLILAMSLSSFAQYFFGQVNHLVLTADQKIYISYSSQIVTIVLNTAASVILMNVGASIHFVKLSTSAIFLLRPLFLQWYVRRRYKIDKKIKYDEEPIKQKWNGVAQHISAVVLDSTDIIVLTVLSDLANVSIYSVYYMVVNGIKKILTTMTSGIQSKLGMLIALKDEERLNNAFSNTEWIIHSASTFLFGCTCCLIVPFVSAYTSGIDDVNYIVPVFGILLTVAFWGHSLRLPYNIMILSAGHYKQTQKCYITAAALNVVISVLSVIKFGLVGVAVGTLVSMLYQTIWMAYYCYNNLLHRNILLFWKQLLIDVACIAASYYLTGLYTYNVLTYVAWVLLALKVMPVVLLVCVLLNVLGNGKTMHRVLSKKLKKSK